MRVSVADVAEDWDTDGEGGAEVERAGEAESEKGCEAGALLDVQAVGALLALRGAVAQDDGEIYGEALLTPDSLRTPLAAALLLSEGVSCDEREGEGQADADRSKLKEAGAVKEIAGLPLPSTLTDGAADPLDEAPIVGETAGVPLPPALLGVAAVDGVVEADVPAESEGAPLPVAAAPLCEAAALLLAAAGLGEPLPLPVGSSPLAEAAPEPVA